MTRCDWCGRFPGDSHHLVKIDEEWVCTVCLSELATTHRDKVRLLYKEIKCLKQQLNHHLQQVNDLDAAIGFVMALPKAEWAISRLKSGVHSYRHTDPLLASCLKVAHEFLEPRMQSLIDIRKKLFNVEEQKAG